MRNPADTHSFASLCSSQFSDLGAILLKCRSRCRGSCVCHRNGFSIAGAPKRVFLENVPVVLIVAGITCLERLLCSKDGRPITVEALESFFFAELEPKVNKDEKPFVSRDGKVRLRYSVGIDMVPEHLDIRARKFVPIVKKNAERFGIEPELLMAMIHTESYFNPLAVSHAGAIGLIQVIPRYAGREAYQYLYESNWIISPEYLYSPGINIEIGSAYLHLLRTRHFVDVKGTLKNRYVSIYGYNWGPSSMREKILNRYPVSNMSDEELFSLLKTKTPKETRDYLVKVTNRMPIYSVYF